MYKADNDERRVAKYLDYSLNCLLPDAFEPISYKDNPLLFILCVADTIEPSKRFLDYRNEDVLNLISIEYSLRDNFLYVEIDEELYDSEGGYRYASDIDELEKWCDIKTNVTSKRLRKC